MRTAFPPWIGGGLRRAALDEDAYGFKADWVGKPNVSELDAMRDKDGRIILVSRDGKTLVPTNYQYEP